MNYTTTATKHVSLTGSDASTRALPSEQTGKAPHTDFGLTIAQLHALRDQANARLDRALFHSQYEKATKAAKEVREISTWISERHAIRG